MQRDIDNGGDGENAPSRQQVHIITSYDESAARVVPPKILDDWLMRLQLP
jgi:hypothetical protein